MHRTRESWREEIAVASAPHDDDRRGRDDDTLGRLVGDAGAVRDAFEQMPVVLVALLRECENCEFKAEVKINHGGNSGMYFRAKFGPEWPAGYEAQVNNTHSDWRRTGSLYRFADIKEQLIPDDTWWTQQVIANGNHIIIKVND